jgi:hypothetical protein
VRVEEEIMDRLKKPTWLLALGIGLAAGLVLSGVWPHTPLHAVATDHGDTYAMATGPLDTEVEAVYFLDYLTGDLKALAMGKQPGAWTGFFERNVMADLGVDPQKNPKYLMVTGLAGLRRQGGSRSQPSMAVCYVAEITSGRVAAYAVPWSPSAFSANQMQSGQLILVGAAHFRQGSDLGIGPVAPPKAREGKN